MQWYAAAPHGGASPDGDAPDRAHRRAMELGDEVVQQLAVAKYALSVADVPRAISAIDAALGIARHSLSSLLDVVCPPDAFSRAGALVRHADVAPPAPSGTPPNDPTDAASSADSPGLPAPRTASY